MPADHAVNNGHSTLRAQLRSVEWPLLLLLFLAAFAVRVWGLSHAHFWDENVYLQNALTICCGRHNWNELHNRPPLLSLLFAGGFLLWHNDYGSALITAAVNALCPVLLYFAGRRFVPRAAAAIASLLMAFTPFLVNVFPPESTGFVSDDTGHSLLTDSPALTLLVLALLLLVRALERETSLRFAFAGLAFAMCVLMRFGSLSSVGVLSLLLLTAARPLRATLACAGGLIAGIAPYLCWSRLRYGGFFTTFVNGWHNYEGTRESPLYYVRYAPYIFGWAALLGCALWILRAGYERSRSDRSKVVGTWTLSTKWSQLSVGRELFLCLWAAALLLFFTLLPHQEPRYMMPATIPVFLLAGSGLSWLLEARSSALRFAARLFLVALLVWEFFPDRERFDSPFIDSDLTDVMRASQFLNGTLPAGTCLSMNSSFPDFAYYTNFPIRTLPRHGSGLYSALEHPAPGTALVAFSHFDNGDVPEPSVAALDSNPHWQRLQQFGNIVLYRSSPPGLPTAQPAPQLPSPQPPAR